MRRWSVLWEMIFWMKWNEKMVRYVMTMILAMVRNMKVMMKLNLCMTPLKKVLDINYTYGYLKQPTKKDILWRVTIIFISQRMSDRYGSFIAKGR